MYVFKSESAVHRKAILAALLEVGLKWHDGDDGDLTPKEIEERFPFEDYPVIVWDKEDSDSGLGICGDVYSYDKYNSLDSFLKKEAGKISGIITVDLTDDYEAKINKDNIEVGCQVIPFEKVEEVYNKMKELRK